MSGDKRAFDFDGKKTDFADKTSEEEFNEYFGKKQSFQFDGKMFHKGYGQHFIDPEIPTECQEAYFTECKLRMERYLDKHIQKQVKLEFIPRDQLEELVRARYPKFTPLTLEASSDLPLKLP